MKPLFLALALASLGGTAPSVMAQPAPAASAPAPTTTPGIAGVVAPGTAIEFIKDGFKGTEGPLGLPDGSLIFTETQDQRITRIAPDGSVSPYLEKTNGANGLGIGPDGALYAVQVAEPRVGVIAPTGFERVLAVRFEGKNFGRPNDLVVDRKGHVYFTDSGANVPAGQTPPPAAPPAVYRISNEGALQKLADGIERPNGIQLSPDEKVLYVANTGGEHVLAFDIAANGTVGKRRDFAKLEGFVPNPNGSGGTSGADGLAVDAEGRLYVATRIGVQVFDAKGNALGVIPLPRAPQNIAFAGPGKQYLYIVGRGGAWRIRTLAAGFSGRAK